MGFFRSIVFNVIAFLFFWSSGLLLILIFPSIPLVDPFPITTLVAFVFLFLGLLFSVNGKIGFGFVLLSAYLVVSGVANKYGREQKLPADAQLFLGSKKVASATGMQGMLPINGKSIALVTGSTRGLGLVVAEKLVSHGWTVLIHGRRVKDMRAAAASINGKARKESGGRAIALGVDSDLSSLEATKVLADDIVKTLTGIDGTLDLLIMNAGVAVKSAPERYSGPYDYVMTVNCVSGALLELLINKKIQGVKRVVHVTSMSHLGAPLDLQTNANISYSLPPSFDDT